VCVCVCLGWGGSGAVWAVTLSFIIREPQRQQHQANETVPLGRMAVESFFPACHVTDASVKESPSVTGEKTLNVHGRR
jgi:hypothetical protein